jgi:uncharacterized membrane protein
MKNRNPLAVFGLSIITFGIYDLYWLAVTRKELNDKTQQDIPSIWLLILSVIPLIVGYSIIISASTNSADKPAHRLVLTGVVLTSLGALLALVVSLVWFFNFSKAVNEYTSGKMSTAISFLILWLIHLLGVALIQDVFNDMVGSPQLATAAATPGIAVAPLSVPQASPVAPQTFAPTPQPSAQIVAPNPPAAPVASTVVAPQIVTPTTPPPAEPQNTPPVVPAPPPTA